MRRRRPPPRLRPEEIKPEHIEHALDVMARIVMLPGCEWTVPFFERLERDLAAARSRTTALDRARARLGMAA
jgi:hypothetical protein